MKTCNNCTYLNEDSCAFCVKCGAPLGQPAVTIPMQQPMQAAAVQTMHPMPQQAVAQKKNSIAIWSLILLIISPIWSLATFANGRPSLATMKNFVLLAGIVTLIFALKNAKKLKKKRVLSTICAVFALINLFITGLLFWNTANYDWRLGCEVCAVHLLEGELKDPSSLSVHEIAVCGYENLSGYENYYTVAIDYSANNSFGAQVRNQESYTFFVQEDENGDKRLYKTDTKLPYVRDGCMIYSPDEVNSWMFAWS